MNGIPLIQPASPADVGEADTPTRRALRTAVKAEIMANDVGPVRLTAAALVAATTSVGDTSRALRPWLVDYCGMADSSAKKLAEAAAKLAAGKLQDRARAAGVAVKAADEAGVAAVVHGEISRLAGALLAGMKADGVLAYGQGEIKAWADGRDGPSAKAKARAEAKVAEAEAAKAKAEQEIAEAVTTATAGMEPGSPEALDAAATAAASAGVATKAKAARVAIAEAFAAAVVGGLGAAVQPAAAEVKEAVRAALAEAGANAPAVDGDGEPVAVPVSDQSLTLGLARLEAAAEALRAVLTARKAQRDHAAGVKAAKAEELRKAEEAAEEARKAKAAEEAAALKAGDAVRFREAAELRSGKRQRVAA